MAEKTTNPPKILVRELTIDIVRASLEKGDFFFSFKATDSSICKYNFYICFDDMFLLLKNVVVKGVVAGHRQE